MSGPGSRPLPRLKIVYLSGREADYMRNRVLLQALARRHDVALLTPRLPTTVGRTAWQMARSALRLPPHDLCFAGFYGQPLAIWLDWLGERPLILDAYISTFDTLCDDRRVVSGTSPSGRLAYWLDARGLRAATRIITDTRAHAEYFHSTFGVPAARISPVPVGCDESLFAPRSRTGERGHPLVFYYGAFLPLHGAEVVVEAARLLRDSVPLRFVVGGDGPGRARAQALAREYRLDNLLFPGWIDTPELPEWIAQADICLGGHYSAVPKAARVVPTKVFQFLAMERATIAGDSPAIRELFSPGEDLLTVPMADAEALAQAIVRLAEAPEERRRLATNGREAYLRQAGSEVLERALDRVICDAVEG